MGFLDRIRALNHWEPGRFRPFAVGEHRCGFVTHALAARLAAYPRVFEVEPAVVRLVASLEDPDERTTAVDGVLRPLQDAGTLPRHCGEPYAVVEAWGAEPVLCVDRGAAAALGIRAFGIHVNGYVRADDGVSMWMGRRSNCVRVDPGTWDHIVAGGQPHGLTLAENLRKECDEEAAIPAALADTARSAGVVTYRLENAEGLKDDTIFVYDLELPPDFVPTNRDGEVAAFERWPMAKVMAAVRGNEVFKFNVGPVITDFLIRHGWLGPSEPDYVEIVRALRA